MSYMSPEPPGPSPRDAAKLDSWKQIAAYLGREVRTAQRWEKGEGLPVHRHQHGSRGTVFAYPSEIDAWLASRSECPATTAMTATASTPERSGGARWIRLNALAAAVAAVLVALWFSGRPGPADPSARNVSRLLVLPLEAIGADPLEETTGRILHEELIRSLAALDPERLSVIGRTSAMRYDATGLGLPELGASLGVDHVLEGSVRRREGKLQVVARLVRIEGESEVWSESYSLAEAELPRQEDRFAREVCQALALELLDHGDSAAPAPPNEDPRARAAWQRGRYLWHKGTRKGFEASIPHYEEALEHDARYAPAHVGLASAYGLLGRYGAKPPREVFPKARAAAERALELDPDSAEAHSVLALVHFYYDWNFDAAAREFHTALRLGPELALTHHTYAHFLSCLGLHEEGLASARKARELEPLWPLVIADTAWFHYRARDFESAAAESRRALELEPGMSSAVHCLVESLRRMGEERAAWAEMRADLDARGLLARVPGIDGDDPRTALDNVRRWYRDEVERVAEERFVSIHSQVFSLTGLNRDDEVLEWLDASVETRDRVALLTLVHPAFDELREDPRFRTFVQNMGFPSDPARLLGTG